MGQLPRFEDEGSEEWSPQVDGLAEGGHFLGQVPAPAFLCTRVRGRRGLGSSTLLSVDFHHVVRNFLCRPLYLCADATICARPAYLSRRLKQDRG